MVPDPGDVLDRSPVQLCVDTPVNRAADRQLVPTEAAAAEATFWNIADIQFHCRMGRSTAWRLVRTAGFPAPVVLSARGLFWPREEVVAFMESRRDAGHYAQPVLAARPEPTGPGSFVVRPVRHHRRR